MPLPPTLPASVFALLLAVSPASPSPSDPSPPPELQEAVAAMRQIPASQRGESESARLGRLFALHWKIQMLEYPTYATFVGYPGQNDRWDDSSPAGRALALSIIRDEQKALESIDRAKLSPREQTDFDLFRLHLEADLDGERFEEIGEAFGIGPMGGPDLTLLNLLDYAPVRNQADFEAILARLRGFPHQVEQILVHLRSGLAKGLTPPKVTLTKVPARVASLVTDDPWKSPILAPFQTLPAIVPAPEQERLRAEALRIYTGSVAPALRQLSDYLADTYVPQAREAIALTALPGGKELYAYQLRHSTTTTLSPEEIYELGLREVARIEHEMEATVAAMGFKGTREDLHKFLRTDPRFYYDRPEDLVAGFRDIVKRVDPALIKLFGHLPRLPYGVKALEGEQAKTAPAAYYNSGSLAAGQPGWFLVNTYDLPSRPKWQMEALALHEAVPGHHLQYSLAAELDELPEWRKWEVYPAFGEGWGLYAESLGAELGLYQDPYSKYGGLSNEIWRAIRLVVDPGIHLKGWSRQEAIDYYKAHCAKPLPVIENEVDRIITQPGSVPCYKVGQLKIRELRTYAEKELGPRFDIRAFHDRLLGRGQLPLAFLEREMKTWVAEEKAKRN